LFFVVCSYRHSSALLEEYSECLRRLASLFAARAMDFHGQKLAEDAYQVIIAFSVISFIAGYSQR